MASQSKKFSITLPEDVYNKLVTDADKDLRSVSAQAAYIIINFYENQKTT